MQNFKKLVSNLKYSTNSNNKLEISKVFFFGTDIHRQRNLLKLSHFSFPDFYKEAKSKLLNFAC